MSTFEITKQTTETSPRSRTKVVIAYYVMSVVTGVFLFFFHDRLGSTAEVASAVLYLATTAWLYSVSRTEKVTDKNKKDRI